MSADDFQTKYSSVMEAMLKSAVSETTKLFETMVNELKAEISQIKKENEDLKTRCSQFECERSQQTAFNRETGQRDGSEKRDTATQCDLVPFRTILVEKCQPLRLSSLQNRKQQCGHEEMEYVLKECNHETNGEGNSQMAFIHVKQEDDSSLQSPLEQEEIESTVVFGQQFNDNAESPWASTCGTEKEGLFIDKVSSNKEILWPQRQEESQVIFEVEHSVVVSLAETKGDKEEESGISQKISESGTQAELMSSETHQLLVSQPQSNVERFGKEQPRVINAQTDVSLQQYADVQSTVEHMALPRALDEGEACCQLKNGKAEVETSSQPDFSVRQRRGRPPKKVKYPQQQVKEKLQSPSSDFPTEQEVKKSSTVRMKDISAVKRVNITSSDSPQVCSFQPKESLRMITSSVQEKAKTALEDVDNSKMGSPTVTVASLSIQSYSTKEKTSESQQTSIEMEEGKIQAQSTEVSSAIGTPITPSNESPPVPSVHSKEHQTSVTLQDAILLVEAMNQSIEENTLSPLRMTATPQAQYVPHVDEVSAVQQTPLHSVATHDAVANIPITELSTKMKSSAPSQTTDASPTSDAQAHFKFVLPKQQHVVSLSDTVSSTSIAATQTNVQSLQQHCPYPLITLVTPSRQDKTVPHKIIVIPRSFSSLMPHKISEQTSTKLPSVTSTAVVAQNASKLSSSTSAGTPSLSSVPQKTMYIISSKLLPVVTQCNSTSVDPQSGTQLHSKYTMKIPRQMSAVASRKHHSRTVVATAQQESAKSAAPVMVSSSQLISSPQELRVSQTALDEMASTSSEKSDDASKNLLPSNQTEFVSEMKNAQTETSSSGKMSVGLVPTLSSAITPTSEKKFSAVVRLSRLPFSISTKDSVLVSQLPTNGSFDSESVLKDTQHNTSSSVFISTQPSETHMLSTDICPSLKDTSVAVAVNTSQNLNEPIGIQEKATFSSENCITLDETPHNSCVQLSARSKVSQPVFEKSTVAIDMKFSATTDTVGDPTSKLPEEITGIAVQQRALAKDHLIEEKQSSSSLNPTSMALKDTSDPHLQMTKTQFLAQLAVSPVAQESEKASPFDSLDARPSSAETSTSEMKKLPKNSIIALLGSHIKTHLQARRTETKLEPGTDTVTQTVSPKKPRLEDDYQNAKNKTGEPITQTPKNPAAEDVPSLKNTITDPTSISPETCGPIENGTKPKRTVRDPSFVSSRRQNATCESTPVNHRRPSSSRDVGSRNEKSFSANPMKSFSSRDGVGTKNKKCTYLHPRRTCLTKDGAGSKNVNIGSGTNNTRTTSVRPKRTCMSRDGSCTKNTTSSASPATSGLTKNSTNPKIPISESTSVIHRGCDFTEDGSSNEQIIRESNLYIPGSCSTTTTQGETNSSSRRSPKLAKNDVSHRKTEETTFKKQKISQDGGSSEKNLRVVPAKLAEAAKAKGIAKMKRSSQSKLQDGAKTSQLAENNANTEDIKKYAAKAVWTPPKMLASKTPPTGGKRSVHLPEKKEANFPRSHDPAIVYPPSVSLHPIPVRAPPIVSPLQPLSVIGWRLLKNQCGECGRVLSSSAALESHVSLHKGQRPFSCTLCGKHFPDSKGLKRHGRVHRNGRIHVCQKCGKGFVYRFCLTKHIQMVHSKIRPFVCQICDKGFFTKRDVEAHIRLHTGEKPFHCNLCEKKFARRVELNVHLRWHNGEKRHWCPYCGKGFLDFNNLKRHKYVHTGEKPHSCPHCPKNFKQSGHLKKHVRNVHKVL